MSNRSTFTGSLGGKRKHELVEIAEALEISDPEAKMSELKDKIQAYLDANETKLSKTPQFKGLYGRKRLYVDTSSSDRSQSRVMTDIGTALPLMRDLLSATPRLL